MSQQQHYSKLQEQGSTSTRASPVLEHEPNQPQHTSAAHSSLRRRSSVEVRSVEVQQQQMFDDELIGSEELGGLEDISLEDDDGDELVDEEMGGKRTQRQRQCYPSSTCSTHNNPKLASLKTFTLWVMAGGLVAACVVAGLSVASHSSMASIVEENPEVVILPLSLAKLLGLMDACFTLVSTPNSDNNKGSDGEDDETERTGSISDSDDSDVEEDCDVQVL